MKALFCEEFPTKLPFRGLRLAQGIIHPQNWFRFQATNEDLLVMMGEYKIISTPTIYIYIYIYVSILMTILYS